MTRHRAVTAIALALLCVSLEACTSSSEEAGVSGAPGKGECASVKGPDGDQVGAIEAAMRHSMAEHHLNALMVRVTKGDEVVFDGAMGESMVGVPATTEMHFRGGAVALSYMGAILSKLDDEQALSLDDPLSNWMPDAPHAGAVTLRMLASMTAGYADYVYQEEMLDALDRDPFRQWTNEELLEIGLSKPLVFEPGTNFGYSHTNYVLLGEVLQKVTGKPMAAVMEENIIGPADLENTTTDTTPAVPEPVLHTFSSERREPLGVPFGTPFYEEATFWNPSWTTASGAVITTNICDWNTTSAVIGSGRLLSPEAHQNQVTPLPTGFGEITPACSACRTVTPEFSYGLGVVLRGPWVTQTKSFAGSGATMGYLPSQELSVSVVDTLGAGAFDDTGAARDPSPAIFAAVAAQMAPDDPPPIG